jgi:D-glycero-alpha-D-manno-heptose-7-phosphate kinase
MLFFTGFSRLSSEIQVTLQQSLEEKANELAEMRLLVYQAEDALNKKDLHEFGRLLDYTWCLKRSISSGISNSNVDDMYAFALKNGAVGGKLLGAGGGGFLLFYCEKQLQPRLREVLKNFMYVPFEFENRGSQVIYYDAEDYDI